MTTKSKLKEGSTEGIATESRLPDIIDSTAEYSGPESMESEEPETEATSAIAYVGPGDYYRANISQGENLNDSAEVWNWEKNPSIILEITGIGKILGEGKTATHTYEGIDVESGEIILVPQWSHIKEQLDKEILSGNVDRYVYVLRHMGKKELSNGKPFHKVALSRIRKVGK